MVGSGSELRVPLVRYRNSNGAHGYTVELSREELRRIFDALLDAAEEKEVDLQ